MTIIGTVRPEEARVFDDHAGYHQFHEEPEGPLDMSEPKTSGSFEVFWHCGADPVDEHDDGPNEPGWYWWACQPGCLPDGDPNGPFASSLQALCDADEWHPEYSETA